MIIRLRQETNEYARPTNKLRLWLIRHSGYLETRGSTLPGGLRAADGAVCQGENEGRWNRRGFKRRCGRRRGTVRGILSEEDRLYIIPDEFKKVMG